MSHTTAIKGLQIKDLAALRQTVKELQAAGVKCSLIDNAAPRMYYRDQHAKGVSYGNNGVCAHVLKLDGCKYDVGFDKQADGSYTPILDAWADEIRGQIGLAGRSAHGYDGDVAGTEAIAKLLQGYAKNATINAAVAQGYSVESCYVDTAGSVQIVLGVM